MTMVVLKLVLQVSSAVTGVIAAMLWFLASRVRLPPFPDVGWDSASAIFDPIHVALTKSSRLNAWAALAATVAAVCGAILAGIS